MSGRRWTEEELEQLATWFGEIGIGLIAQRLGRTIPACYVQAQKMHLGREMPAGAYTMNGAMEMLGVVSTAVMQRFMRDGWLPGKRRLRQGTQRPDWIIRHEHLEQLVKEHPEQFDYDRMDPGLRQFMGGRWVTLVAAFRRGAAAPFLLEAAVKAGLIPEARRRGVKGTWWVIPDSAVAGLIEARKRMTSDEDHRKLVLEYNRLQRRNQLARKRSAFVAKARKYAA